MSDSAAGSVRIEIFAWITKFIGGDGGGRRRYDEPLLAGDTVRTVLRRFGARFPDLDRALWDAETGELGEHVEVVVNNAVLDIHHTIDSPLAPGDVLTLVGQYIGG